MACRKDVFQSKVLRRLYPATPKLEKKPSPPHSVESLANNACVKRKTPKGGLIIGSKETTQSVANPGRRAYTVAPPPADFKAHAEESVNLPSSGSTNSDKDSAEHDSAEEIRPDQDEQKRRRRRRKRKTSLPPQSGRGGAAQVGEPNTEPSETPENDGQECMSKNKRRKLKKKRHKEKLRSMGLIPQAAALEFTYKKDGEEEEEEDDERRATEVSDFLRTTMKLYASDSSSQTNKPRLPPGVVDDLASSVATGSKPASVLKQLHDLKSLVHRREMDRLEEALQELRSSSSMSAGETAAVVSLFQYWITDILPMSDDKKAELPAALA